MSAPVAERTLQVVGAQGLHARPAAEFSERASCFAADISLVKAGVEVDAKSVLLVLTLDVRQGDRVVIRAQGNDADRAVEELAGLIGAP